MSRELKVYIALLRGINVGGRASIAMAELRDVLVQLGMANVRSVLQSGNLVFEAGARDTGELERLFELETKKRFGLPVDFFVRTAAQWESVVNDNPMTSDAEAAPAHFVVMLLKEHPAPALVRALQEAIAGPERISAGTRCAYLTYPAGIGRSRVTNAWLERGLATRGTARNWNTVLKLAALSSGHGP